MLQRLNRSRSLLRERVIRRTSANQFLRLAAMYSNQRKTLSEQSVVFLSVFLSIPFFSFSIVESACPSLSGPDPGHFLAARQKPEWQAPASALKGFVTQASLIL